MVVYNSGSGIVELKIMQEKYATQELNRLVRISLMPHDSP